MGKRTTLTICRTAVGYEDTPESGKTTWDGAKAVLRLRKWSGVSTAEPSAAAWTKYRRGFAWFDAENRSTVGAYKLPHHDVEGGNLVLNRAGLIAAGGAVQGARGGVDIPAADILRVKSHLGRHYRALGLTPPWKEEAAAESARGYQRSEEGAGKDGRVLLARADEDKKLIYLIVSRANDEDGYGNVFPPEEVERSAHRFMQRQAIGINHECNCGHDFRAHAQGAAMGTCRGDGCTCLGYDAVEAPVTLVENFLCGVDAAEWHGAPLAEPFKRGDHVIVLHCESPILWSYREAITGASWEGTVEIEPIAETPATVPSA